MPWSRCRVPLVLAFLVGCVGAQPPRFAVIEEMIDPFLPPVVGAADFDGDGDLDLLFEPLATGGGQILLNDGSARFLPGPTVPGLVLGYGQFTGIVRYPSSLADFDGDGDVDLIANGNSMAAWSNDGTGQLAPAPWTVPSFPTLSGEVSDLTGGDVDGDGDVDLVIGANLVTGGHFITGGAVTVWLNDGLGNFTHAPSAMPGGNLLSSQVELADLDADGDRDLLVVSLSGNGVSVLWNNGAGVFVAGSPLPISSPRGPLVTGDANGDGLTDIAVSAGLTGPVQIRVFLARPGGTWSALPPFATSEAVSWRIPTLFLDVTGDGVDEVLFATREGLTALDARSTVGLIPLPQHVPAAGERMATGDLDGDGDADLVVSSRAVHGDDPYGHRVVLNVEWGLAALEGTSTTAPFARGLVGDADADGDSDLIDWLGGPVIYRNDGGTLAYDATVGWSGASPAPAGTPLLAFDVEGDGDDDLLLAGLTYTGGQFQAQDRILLNHGGTWSPGFSWPLIQPGGSSLAAAAGDLDLDGDKDLIVSVWGGVANRPTQIYFNTGGGSFGPPVPLSSTETWAHALTDLDARGDLDIVQANYGSRICQLYWNDGAGSFTLSPGHFGPITACDVSAGDVNGDGIVDLLFGRHVWFGTGGGAGFNAGALPLPYPPCNASLLLDADGDGDLDVASGSVWYENDGTSPGSWPSHPLPMEAFRIADFDRDGDQDLLGAGPFILTNMTRQLARGSRARPGRLASLEVAGQPGEVWWLALSRGPANIPFPPYGNVLIDPLSAVAVGSGTFGPDGRAVASLPIPAWPQLVGQTYWWQAAVAGPTSVALTGARSTTVLAY